MSRIETDEYTFTYGHHPRGRGSWAFGTTQNADPCDTAQCFWTPGSTTFAGARELARAWAKANGHSVLFVLT